MATLVTLAAGGSLLVGAPAEAGPSPMVTVTPNTDLVDEQVVTVHGEGVDPTGFLHISLCRAPAGPGDCAENFGVDPDAADSGAFTLTVQLEAVFTIDYDGPTVDCRSAPGSCVIEVRLLHGIEGSGDHFEIPLTFDPSAPLAPAPAIAVDPASGLVDGQSVAVTGTGFDRDGISDGDANGFVEFVLCTTPTYDSQHCSGEEDWPESTRTDGNGSIDVPVRLHTIVRGPNPDVDCRLTSCHLVALGAPFADQASAPLAFDASAPSDGADPAPPTVVAAEPAFTG